MTLRDKAGSTQSPDWGDRLVAGGTKESEVREPARPGRQTDKSAHSPASGVRGGGLVVTSGTSRTSLGSGEGKRLGAQGCVLVEDLTTGPTPDTEKSKVTEKCPDLGERRRREEGDSPRTVSLVPPPKTPHSDTDSHKKPSLGGPRPVPAPHLQLCWRKWGPRPRLVSAHRGASAPRPLQQMTGQGAPRGQQAPWTGRFPKQVCVSDAVFPPGGQGWEWNNEGGGIHRPKSKVPRRRKPLLFSVELAAA